MSIAASGTPEPTSAGAELTEDVHVALAGIGKRFQSTEALTDISLTIARGSVHALVGENGAGKSTLGKIISGVIRPDRGQVFVDGRPVHYRSPRDALADRIAAMKARKPFSASTR